MPRIKKEGLFFKLSLKNLFFNGVYSFGLIVSVGNQKGVDNLFCKDNLQMEGIYYQINLHLNASGDPSRLFLFSYQCGNRDMYISDKEILCRFSFNHMGGRKKQGER